MTQIIGHLKNLSGKFFAKDEQGNLREIFSGDPVYGGEVVVDESGKIIQEVLQISTQDEIDQNSGELDIEAALRRDDFEYDSPEGVIDAVRSTVSINSIDSPLSEEDFDVLLREAEFYIENTGLIQEHEASNEVSVDAPLREYGFDRYEIGNMGRFTDNYNLNQVEDFGNIVGSTPFDSPTSSNDPFNPSDRNLLNIPSIPSDPNSPNIPSIPNDPNPPSTPSNPSFSNIPNNSNPPSTPNDPNLPNIPSTSNNPNDSIDPSRPLDSNPPNTLLIPTDPNDLTDPSRPLDSKDPEEKVVGGGGGGGFVPPHVPTANPDTNRATEDDTTSIISANIFDNTSDDSQDDVIGTDITPTPVTGVKAGSDTSTNAVGNIGLDVVGNYGTVQIANDGNYTYRLDNTKVEVQALNNEETLTDTFIYTITDDDGDTSTTTLTITIYGDNNDLPTLSINPEIVYESALVDGSSPDDRDIVSDTFTVGAIDGLKEIVVDGHIISKAELLISDTTAIIIENTTDKSNKLVINGFDESTGEVKYTYTLLDNNDNTLLANDASLTDTISIVVNDTDESGTTNSVTKDLLITIIDDTAVAKDNNATVVEGATEITGNVITNTDTTDGTDAVGADGAMLNEFTYRDINGVQQSIIFTDNTNQMVTTKTGSLTVNQDGAWTFTPIASVVHDDTNAIDESFKYKLIDNDGDISNEATNTITVTDTIATVTAVDTVLLDEDDLSNGSDTAKESLVSADTTLGITVGQDDITDVVFDLTKVSADSDMIDLKSDGEALVFSVDATNHILTAKDHSGSDVFVVTINDNGIADKYDEGSTYKFELKGSLDHASADGENTISVDIPFSIKEIDDIVNAKMRVDVVDDVPIANDNPQQDTVEGSGVALGGNLIVDADATDIVGADNAELKEFTYRDDSGVEQTLIFADDTNQTVQTETGELTINRNGIWTFDPVTSFDHDDNLEASDSLESTDDMPEDASNASFSYTLVDGDGDESTAKQIINVIDGANPTIDNSKNTLIRVYEGDSISNLDGGTTKYDESDKTEIKENTATLTHKLDFTEGSDTAYISSITWEGRTKNLLRADGTFVNARKIVDDDKGILKVFKDGTWEYTPPATYEHDNPTTPDTFDINSLTTTFSYKVHDIDNDEVTGGSQSIQIDDTIATITEITDVLLNEANLASGTDPENTELTQTGSITVDDQYLGGADHTVRFKAIQSDTILTIDNDGDGESDLSSLGSKVHHEVSADGFTLTLLNESNESILTTTIDNPTAENITYTTVLSKSFNQTPALHRDESGNQDDDGMFYFEFDIEVEDDDGDIRDAEFKVTIADDETPDTGSMIVNEDSTENILQSNANVTQDNTEIITQGAHGIAQIDINGKFNYVPTENYSGVDQVIVETTLDERL